MPLPSGLYRLYLAFFEFLDMNTLVFRYILLNRVRIVFSCSLNSRMLRLFSTYMLYWLHFSELQRKIKQFLSVTTLLIIIPLLRKGCILQACRYLYSKALGIRKWIFNFQHSLPEKCTPLWRSPLYSPAHTEQPLWRHTHFSPYADCFVFHALNSIEQHCNFNFLVDNN